MREIASDAKSKDSHQVQIGCFFLPILGLPTHDPTTVIFKEMISKVLPSSLPPSALFLKRVLPFISGGGQRKVTLHCWHSCEVGWRRVQQASEIHPLKLHNIFSPLSPQGQDPKDHPRQPVNWVSSQLKHHKL